MSYTGPGLEKAFPLLKAMPEGTYFDISKPCEGQTPTISFQAQTQDEVRSIRNALPHTKWNKRWNVSCYWWEYYTTIDGLDVNIYAVKEAPQACRAVMKKETVIKRVPVAFKEEIVVQEVIDHWDCQGED